MTITPDAAPNQSAWQSRDSLSPDNVLQILKDGNRRFVAGALLERDWKRQVMQTAGGQFPIAIVMGCIDSRIPTGVVFDQGIGDLFDVRMAGNVLNDDILGCMEFACKMAGSKLVLVVGHTSCGAVCGACDNARLGHVTQLLQKIAPAVEATATADGEDRSSANLDFVNRVAAQNVNNTLTEIRRQSSILREMEDAGEIAIVGAMYDVASGEVTFFDEANS